MFKKDIELFYEPIEILGKLDDSTVPEMTDRQLALICGLIKQHRPKKIVEIGIAAGRSTAVLLNCISMLDLDVQLFSCDLLTYYYRDSSKPAGYLAQECKPFLNKQPKHTFYTGKYSPEYLEEIGVGGGIDLLLLDTVHRLPGELFDFLACYPFLHRGSIVVVHDVVLNHYEYSNAYAAKILMDAVTAEKILDMDEEDIFPNIGVFVINEDTDKYIDSVFSALTITWGYMPPDNELALYREFYKKYYSAENLNLYDLSVDMQRKTLSKQRDMCRNERLDNIVQAYKWIYALADRNVYIYGCGNYGKQFYNLLTQCDIHIAGYIVSDGQNIDEVEGNVYHLSEVDFDDERDVVLIGVNPSLCEEICMELNNKNIDRYIIPGGFVYDWFI